MRSIIKKILVAVLIWEAKLVLKKYKPKVIAVTGSVGKTSTKDAIFTVLSPYQSVRKSEKSFNSEIGVPLTILGVQNGWYNPAVWIGNVVRGLELIFLKNDYPKCLILEVGADRPGDIKFISSWLKTDVAVFTRIGPMPVHVEYFESRADLIGEKRNLVNSLKPDGVLVLNADDEDIIKFKEGNSHKCLTFSIHTHAEVTASNDSIVYETLEGVKEPIGFGFKVNYEGNSVPVTLTGVLGLQHLYPVLAAVTVGISQGLNMVDITTALREHLPPRGRMNLIQGINHSTVIDDTYNSSPVALYEALDIMAKTEAQGRRIAVVGDMLELGKFTAEQHKIAGERLAHVVKNLVTVGPRARHFKEGAKTAGMNVRSIVSFDTSREAAEYMKTHAKKGDVILVKGSQSMRMERIVEAIMAHPENRKSLLVRQEDEWLKKE